MNDIHESDSAHQDADIERRLRALHDVVREAVCEEPAAADRRLASILDTPIESPVRRRLASGPRRWLMPLQRAIIAVDIEGSTGRNNLAKAALREDLYEIVEAAMDECGITEDLREPFLDRGDGLLALVAPADEVPKARLLTAFVPTLAGLLKRHVAIPERRFRLRVAIHAGDVHLGRNGMFGEDVDITARLLDSPELKNRLRQTDAPLVVVVSDHIFRSVVRHGYDGIDDRDFQPLVQLDVCGWRQRGWVHVPEDGARSMSAGRTA